MKICFLADAAHPNAQNWLQYFAYELGHQVYVISFNRPEKEVSGVEVHYLNYGVKPPYKKSDYHPLNFFNYAFIKSKLKFLLGVPEIKRLIRKIGPDILIGYRVVSYGFSAARTNFHPLVIVGQSQQLFRPENSKILKGFTKYAIKKADLIQAWENHIARKIVELGADQNKIETFPKGVDLEKFKTIANKKPHPFTLVSTRSLYPEYFINSIIKAVWYVKKEIPEIKYLIAGEGSEKGDLIDLTQKLGLKDNIAFLGRVEYANVPELLGSADAYISASDADGVSSSLLEAMACGLFPIVTDNEANRYWITDKLNGFLIPYDDPERIALRILDFFKRKGFSDDYKKINLDLVKEKADWHKNMRRMEMLYLDLINKHQKHGYRAKQKD